MCVSTNRKKNHTHTHPHLQWEELFEWQVGGMAVSDCGDNGILVSLQIVPQEMAENCFWIKVKEEKFENPDLFAQLSLCFSSQSKGKEASSLFIPCLINLHTHASFSLSGNRCQATFILWHFKKPFFLTEMLIILKPSTFSTAFEHHLCMLSSQISVPIRDTNALAAVFVCVFVKARNAMWLLIVFVLCTHWVVSDQCFCACTWMCTNLSLYIYVWTESSYAWFASCLFQSSRPILHRGRWEAFVKEALGVFLSRPVCFSDTQPGYLTCWWITQAVQSKFVFVWRRVCEGTWCIPPMTIWVFFHFFDSVCVCVSCTPLILAAVGGEKSEACQARNSQIWALSGCVDITIQSPPIFPIYPRSVWTPVSPPAASCSVFLTASRSTN